MSEPIRYSVKCGDEGYTIVESLGGDWVRFGENARLKAEVERLRAEKDQAECDYDNCQKRKVSIDNHRFDLFMENKNLKAEVERLRKAGDALAETLEGVGFDSAMDFWNAAKEGKQP